jgi:hypothetical protein
VQSKGQKPENLSLYVSFYETLTAAVKQQNIGSSTPIAGKKAIQA